MSFERKSYSPKRCYKQRNGGEYDDRSDTSDDHDRDRPFRKTASGVICRLDGGSADGVECGVTALRHFLCQVALHAIDSAQEDLLRHARSCNQEARLMS